MDDEQFRQLLDFFELSWSGYRKVRKGVKKRVNRHMQSLGCRRTSYYLQLLREQPTCRRDCEQLMTVSISRFFRDRQLWTFLESNFLPEIAAGTSEPVAIWSAGCASGEEVYSFKIIWETAKARPSATKSISPSPNCASRSPSTIRSSPRCSTSPRRAARSRHD